MTVKRPPKKNRTKSARNTTNPPAAKQPVDVSLAIAKSAILTPRQLEILRYIQGYRISNGYSPTLSEIGDKLQLSKITIFEHVESLVKKGLLHREHNKTRSLTLDRSVKLTPEDKTAALKQTKNKTTSQRNFPAGKYPMAGYIAAGQPMEAIETPDTLDLTNIFETTTGTTFALQVRGQSMIDDHICDGDFVLVNKVTKPQDGQIVVAVMPDGQATLKRFYRQKKGFKLEAANADYKPIHVDKLEVQGVVIGVLRQIRNGLIKKPSRCQV